MHENVEKLRSVPRVLAVIVVGFATVAPAIMRQLSTWALIMHGITILKPSSLSELVENRI